MNKYGVILAAPPWQYDISHRNGSAQKHYTTMSLNDLTSLPVKRLSKPNCILLLWATWPKLAEAALPLIDLWGFKYVTGFPWVKLTGPPLPTLFGDIHAVPAFGTGYWVRGATEPILIAKKGTPRFPDDHPVGILCERMKHSRKPDSIYEYAEMLEGPYLELFGRRKHPGWDVWGNEVESDIELPLFNG